MTWTDHRLALLLPDEDCRRVVGQIANRASELGRTVDGLFDEILEFWLSVPSDVDDIRLGAHSLRFHQLMLFAAADPEATEVTSMSRPLKGAQTGALKSANWRARDNAGVVDRRGERLALSQAREIFEAGTFFPQIHGRTFNGRLTADHGLLPGATDEECAARVSNWLRRLRQSFFVPAVRRHGPSAELHRIAFHERGPSGDLRSTVLLHVPQELEARFSARVSDWSIKLGNPDILKLQLFPTDAGVAAMAQHWVLIRELWGGLDPDCIMDGMPVLEILKVPRSQRRRIGAIDCRRFNMSESIGDQSQHDAALERMGHLSAWADRAWPRLFAGWELREHQDRLAEIRRRQARLQEIRRSYSTSDLELEQSVLQMELAKERASWGVHPHDRPRKKWRVWW